VIASLPGVPIVSGHGQTGIAGRKWALALTDMCDRWRRPRDRAGPATGSRHRLRAAR
jgi:hypothetical protein